MIKKLLGAILSAFVFIALFVYFIYIFYQGSVVTGDVPMFMFLFILIFFVIPLVGVVVALIYRIQEILEGEEEEAKKY